MTLTANLAPVLDAAIPPNKSPKINGAGYTAFDTGDGYITIKDILIFAEVAKGEKDAPEDVKGPRMQEMVNYSTAKYQQDKYAAPVHKGHHKPLEFADPEFLGFVLPKRVGKTFLDGIHQDAVFGDVKVKRSAFNRIQAGELPFCSPEVDWIKWEFSSLSFLDSKPPHFKGPLITIGEVIKDSTATFTVDKSKIGGQFMAMPIGKEKDENSGAAEKALKSKDALEKEAKGNMDAGGDAGGAADAGSGGDAGDAGASGDSGGDAGFTDIASRVVKMEAGFAALDKHMATVHFKMGMPYKGAYMQADAYHKPNTMVPKEDITGGGVTKASGTQNVVRFEDDPTAMAKFAALEAQTKKLEDRLTAKDAEEAKASRISKAFEDLKGWPVTDKAKAGIAKFADQPEQLATFIDVYKSSVPKDAPKSVAAFQAAGINMKPMEGNDPDIAEFQALGQDKAEAAIRYGMGFDVWRGSPLAKFSDLKNDRKKFIKFYMSVDSTGHALDSILPGGI